MAKALGIFGGVCGIIIAVFLIAQVLPPPQCTLIPEVCYEIAASDK